jgi:uncharacterized hydrophobic protein (TIGR00271 family)
VAGRRNIREEKVLQVAEKARLDGAYVLFMAIAGILAAVALLANSVPVLIGSMIVAPAFPPLAMVAFCMVAGQWRLALRALGTALLGLAVAVGFGVLTTWVLQLAGVLEVQGSLFDNPLLEERVRPGWYSVAAAFAAGTAGTLATLKDRLDALVGTVAALALVPAGCAAGIAFLYDDPLRMRGGLVLLAINVGLIIACGILVLVVAGRRYEE